MVFVPAWRPRPGASFSSVVAPKAARSSRRKQTRQSLTIDGRAISKKNCRLATGRNRIKRVVRESFRQHQAALAGLDVVVMNQPAARAAVNQELFDSLTTHWVRCQQKTREKGAQE
jgi:ribonuclease P protein component